MMWPRATIGTTIPDRMFIARMDLEMLWTACLLGEYPVVTSGANMVSPVRMTLARPVDAFLSTLYRALTSVMCWSSDLSMYEAANCLISLPTSTSTLHQSATAGTASLAVVASVRW